MISKRSVRVFAVACTLAGVVVAAASARAQAPLIDGFGGTVDFGTQCLSPNDDGTSAPIDITPAFPNGLLFFGAVHTTAYINTNGNITFSGAVPTYTPNAFPIASQPMIAPYWGDVDIRYTGGSCQGSAGQTCNPCTPCHNPTENGVWWHLTPGMMVVTWDRVGYYSCHNDLRMSFQLILTQAGCPGSGDFDVEFRYNRCEWEAGDASGGSGGFGGTEAQAGFDAGNQIDYVAIPGSMAPGIANLLCTTSNMGTPGVWQYQIRSGAVVCPDAGQPCDTGLLGVCAEGRTICVGAGTECLQDVSPSPEVCDNLDNDCDGQVDDIDDGPICPGTMDCIGGNCINACADESFCPAGLACDTSSGMCVDPACVGVVCPAGQRCDAGQCVGACDGVICPWDLVCRAGHCINLCDGMTCDSCTVCEDGLCIATCDYVPCPVNETCDATGHCIEDACVGVTCGAGFHCVNGTCVDNCDGVACPTGQVCEVGQCVPGSTNPDPDAGVPTDAGTQYPDSWVAVPDADTDPPTSDKAGCQCRSSAGSGFPIGALGLCGIFALFVGLRRRRARRSRQAP
ncbi:MAG: nidogen-like domain-containing protein [bacterium]